MNRFKVSQPWVREEIRFMRRYYRNYETTWIANRLGRTVSSVRCKAVDLCIKKSNPSVWRGNRGPAIAFRTIRNEEARQRKAWRANP